MKVAEPSQSYGMDTSTPCWIEVLVDCVEVQGVYVYRVPADLHVQPGDILSVPFGSQQLGAIAIRYSSELPPNLTPNQVRDVLEVVSRGFFPLHYWELLLQVAQYYQTPLMQVVRVALPPGLLGRSQRRIRLKPEQIPATLDPFLPPTAHQLLTHLQTSKTQDAAWRTLSRQVKGGYRALQALLQRGWVESYLEPPQLSRPKLQKAVTLIGEDIPPDLTPRQREIFSILRQQGGELWMTDALQLCNTTSATLKALEQKGCLVIFDREILRRDQGVPQVADLPKQLTSAQAEAVDLITTQTRYSEILLHGVTGSGKTEVYLQAIAPILERHQSALVLVPEIGLTPQLTDRFRARFGDRVSVYHSALSDGERYDTWRCMVQHSPQIIIGTRSAIFVPLPNLGLIILDEEHDHSFKQDQPAPTYHARTVARWRAQLENIPVVLGSATPALETWVDITHNASSRPKHYLSLPERIAQRPLPPVEVVDMRRELQNNNRSIFSRTLQTSLQKLLNEGKQGILFIPRRGHSTFVSCRSCGYVIECPHCDVSLSYHYTHSGAEELLRCHYCNFTQLYPPQCPECGSPYLKHFGSGTQRVTQELARLFPQLRYIRFDSDTTRTKDAHRQLLTQFANREADILVGTQMLTKGLDLAEVTLVGVVSADGLLHLSDYRASERAFQTLTQVAGRAGRGDDPGKVIIQTYTPDHPVIQAVRNHQFTRFVDTELTQRAALNYPPYGKLVLLRLSGLDLGQVQSTAQAIADFLNPVDDSYELLGPAPAGIMRVADRYRWQILLKFPLETTQNLPSLMELRSHCPSAVSLTIDIDPLQLN